MAKADFAPELEFAVPLERLYSQFAADEGVRNWWTTACAMEPKVGGAALFHFEEDGFTPFMKISGLEANQRVGWRVVHARHPEGFAYRNLYDGERQKVRFEVTALDPGRQGCASRMRASGASRARASARRRGVSFSARICASTSKPPEAAPRARER